MPIPDFQTLMLPLLEFASDREEHNISSAVDFLSSRFNLSDEELAFMLPSGKQPSFENRVGWTRTHLKKAGLLDSSRRSYFHITERGLAILKGKPAKINMAFLKQFPEYLEFIGANRGDSEVGKESQNDILSDKATPEEIIEKGYSDIRRAIASDLLERILSISPTRFEILVIDLLVKMGYGGGFKDSSSHSGKSGDEGIDGTIREDKLGLDIIYIQAKRWKPGNQVGRPEIQKFVGALAGQGAKKGIFITTSSFSKEAREYSPRNETKIVLIDGDELTQLMIDNNIGVSIINTYEIKRVDSDYFGES